MATCDDLRLRARPGLNLGTASAAAVFLLAGCALLAATLALAIGATHTHPRDAISDSPAAVLSLLAHNAGVVGIPLALSALGWDRSAGLASVGDLLIAASLIANGGIVGWVAAHTGLQLAAYLPHLPFEWAALAIAAGAWLCLRRSAPRDRRVLLLRALGLTASALLIAALLEVYAAPLG